MKKDLTENCLDINEQLAEVLGVDFKGRHVSGFTLRVRAGDLPRLTVSYFLATDELDTTRTEKFELHPAGTAAKLSALGETA